MSCPLHGVCYLICIPDRADSDPSLLAMMNLFYTCACDIIMHDHEATDPPPFVDTCPYTCMLSLQYMYRAMNMENESVIDLCCAHAQYGISLVHRVQFCSCTSVF